MFYYNLTENLLEFIILLQLILRFTNYNAHNFAGSHQRCYKIVFFLKFLSKKYYLL